MKIMLDYKTYVKLLVISEVYNAICPKLGQTLHIPEDSVQALFNDMHLYPSKSQVSEMLQCARQCSRRNGTTKYITFGEFCVFVREMKHRNNVLQEFKPANNKCGNNYEVFLGGSCNPTTWRADTAIPELQRHGITYYNPQVSMWAPELIAQEHDAKQSASVLLFVIDSQTRSTTGMIEVAYLVASGRCVVLVAHPYRPGQSIMGEAISQREYWDLVEGQTNLLTLVRSRGLKVHTSLSSALQCTANILKNSTNNGMTAEEQIMNKLRKLREVFDSYGGQQTGQIKVYNALKAFEKLTDRELKIFEINKMFEFLNVTKSSSSSSSNNNINNNNNHNSKNNYNNFSNTSSSFGGSGSSRNNLINDVTNATISFECFCMLMAEFTTDHCDICQSPVVTSSSSRSSQGSDDNNDGIIAWANQSLQRQSSANNNSCDNIVDNSPHIITENIRNNASLYTNNYSPYNTTSTRNFTASSAHLNNLNTSTLSYDVFLGGSRSTHTKWRQNVAIPLLKKHGITYYNPALRDFPITTGTTTTVATATTTNNDYRLSDNVSTSNNKNSNNSSSVSQNDCCPGETTTDGASRLLDNTTIANNKSGSQKTSSNVNNHNNSKNNSGGSGGGDRYCGCYGNTTTNNLLFSNKTASLSCGGLFPMAEEVGVVLRWKQVMDKSKVLLFVITNDTRSLTTMILAAHYIGSLQAATAGYKHKVVLSIERLPEENCVVCNETLSLQAVKDYNRGREYLWDSAIRKNVPVFENITEAVQCTVDLISQNG